MPQNWLAVVTIENRSALPRDRIINTYPLYVPAAPPPPDFGGPITDAFFNFYHSLIPYFSLEADFNHWGVNYYQLDGHLDGSPHGAPTVLATRTGFGGTVITGVPQGCCLLLQWHTAAHLPVSGPEAPIPTDAEGRREGAPSTHLGRPRPASRARGRTYIGPLNKDVVDSAGAPSYRTILNNAAKTVIATAAQHMLGQLLAGGAPLAVWSRRNAQLVPVSSGSVADKFAYQRGREITGGAPLAFPVGP